MTACIVLSLNTLIKQMKNTLFLLFTIILILGGCHSEGSQQRMTHIKKLEKQNKIALPIDESFYFVSKSIFQFEENGKEYLFFENREKGLYDFVNFDLENSKIAKKIPIKREGPDGVPAMMGSRPFPDSKTFLVFQHNISRISLLNEKGQPIRNYKINIEGEFIELNLSSMASWPTFSQDSVIYFSQCSKGRGKKVGYDKIPLFASLDLKTGKIDWPSLFFPTTFTGDYSHIKGDDGMSYDYNIKSNCLVCSFDRYDSIMVVTNDLKEIKWYNAKSGYLKSVKPNVDNHTNDIYGLIRYRESAMYSHMIYDKYNNVYYRFAEMPCELAKDETPYDYFAPKAREFSVIILNDKFEIIGETKFPGNKYFYKMSFVGKDGLYISENNLANPEFDENKLVFACFKIVDNNK